MLPWLKLCSNILPHRPSRPMPGVIDTVKVAVLADNMLLVAGLHFGGISKMIFVDGLTVAVVCGMEVCLSAMDGDCAPTLSGQLGDTALPN